MNELEKGRHYLYPQVIWSFAINVVVNALLAYVLNRTKQYGSMSRSATLTELAIDLLLTGLIIGSLTFLFGVAGVKKEGLTGSWPGAVSRAVKRPAATGALLGLLLAFGLFALVAFFFWLSGSERFSLTGYVFFKAIIAGLMGAAVTGLAVVAALRSVPETKPAI